MVERIRDLLESRQLTPTQFADAIGVARPIVSHILSGRNKPSLEVVQRILAAMPDLAMPWLLNGAGPMLAATSVATIPSVPLVAADVSVAPAPASVAVPADGRARTAVGTAGDTSQAPVHSSQQPEEEHINSAAMPKAAPPRASTPVSNRPRIAPKRFVANVSPSDAVPQGADSLQAPPQPLAEAIERPPAVVPVQDSTPSPSIATPMDEAYVKVAPSQPVPTVETPGEALASALFAGGEKPIRRIVIFYRDGSFADYQPE